MFNANEIESFLNTGFLHQRLLGRLSATDRGPIGSLCSVDSLTGRSLWKFALARPQKFFAHDVFRDTLATIASADAQNIILPLDVQEALKHSLIFLRVQNSTYPDAHLDSQNNEALVLDQIQKYYLSDYVSIAESVYKNILRFLLTAHFAANGISKNVGQKLRDLHDQAKKYLPISLYDAYSTLVRNAISHGSIKLVSEYDVEFRDENSPALRMWLRDCPDLADKLIDCCNAAYAAVLYATQIYPNRLPGLADWVSDEMLLALGSNEMFTLERMREDVVNTVGPQLVVFGTHSIWDAHVLIESTLRALILCKALHGGQSRYLLSTSRGLPSSLFISEQANIPEPNASADLSLFSSHVLGQSLVWNEYTSFIEWIASRFKGRHVVNWLREHERGLGVQDSFEVREIRNNSASFQSRFDSVVVAQPSQADLDLEGFPTIQFLWSIFLGVFLRWTLRGGNQRNPGAKYLRFFRSGLVHVYQKDARVRKLRYSGLSENLLFRLEFSLGTPRCRIALGGRLELFRRIGPFVVSLNPKAIENLKMIAKPRSE